MHLYNKNPHKTPKKGAYSISRRSFMTLRIGLPIILFYLLVFLSILLDSEEIPGYILARKYCYFLEHIVMSATLIVIGALVIDLAEKNTEKDRKQ